MIDALRLSTALVLDATPGELAWALDGADQETVLAITTALDERISALYQRNVVIRRRLQELSEQHPELATL